MPQLQGTRDPAKGMASLNTALSAILERLKGVDPKTGMSIAMVPLPGGIASKADIMGNLGLQARQGYHSASAVPPEIRKFGPEMIDLWHKAMRRLSLDQRVNFAKPYTPYTSGPSSQAGLISDAVKPKFPSDTSRGAVPAMGKVSEREGLWENLLDYLIYTSRQ